MWFSSFYRLRLTFFYSDLLTKLQTFLGFENNQLPWWVKITTVLPRCTYFFGPFNSAWEAKSHQDGYLEDLMKEKALGISIQIKQCQPRDLTVCYFDQVD